MKTGHVAIPCTNINETILFYTTIGASLVRKEDGYVIFDFYGLQLVAHQSLEIYPQEGIYPRHFGVIFKDESEFQEAYKKVCRPRSIKLFKKMFTRFRRLPYEHDAFFVKDPSGNVIEMKYYVHHHFSN